MRNSAKPQQRNPSRNREESIDINLGTPQISPDSPFKQYLKIVIHIEQEQASGLSDFPKKHEESNFNLKAVQTGS